MISRVVRVLFMLSSLAVAVITVLEVGNYTSLLPAKYNFVDQIFAPKSSTIEIVEPQETKIEQADSLEVVAPDSLSLGEVTIE